MKRIICLLLALVFMLSFGISAFALTDENYASIDSKINISSDSTANSNDRFFDLAGLLYNYQISDITEEMKSFEAALGVKFFAITTDDAYGLTTEQYVNDFVSYYCDASSNSVIFAVDYDNNQVYINASPDMLETFTFSEMQSVYSEALEECKSGTSYDWEVYFTLLLRKSVIAIKGDYTAINETYTAENGYSYAYFAPYYDTLLETAHKYDNVWDFADLLTDEEEANLQKLSESRLAEKGVKVFFLTYDNAFGVNETTFTDDFYDFYITKLDFDNQVSGILYAIDMDNRQVYINAANEIYLSASDAYNLLDKSYKHATNEEYYDFFIKTDKVTMKYLYPSILDKAIPTGTSLIASIIVAIALVAIVTAIQKKSNKKPIADVYQTNFKVISRNAVFAGHREEVIVDFYKPSESSGGGGGGGHSSGGGGGHSGGGHGF